MSKEFNSAKMIVSRGNVYNKTTRRWEGSVVEFTGIPGAVEEVPENAATPPDGGELSKSDLVELARERGIAGFSSMSKGDLKEALEATGDITDGEEAS